MNKIILLLALIANSTHLLQSMDQRTNVNYECHCNKNTVSKGFLAPNTFYYLGKYTGIGIMLKPALHCFVKGLSQWNLSTGPGAFGPRDGQSSTKSVIKTTAYVAAAATCLIAGGYCGAQLGACVDQSLAQR